MENMENNEMSDKKSRIEKMIEAVAVAMGATFIGLSIVANKKKSNSVYADSLEQRNPLEGKKVIFVADENDAENADGVRGHLEAVGESKCQQGFYSKYVKRGIDIILSFGGLVLLSPIMGAIALAIKIEDPGPVLFTQNGWERIKNISNYINLEVCAWTLLMMYQPISWIIQNSILQRLVSSYEHIVWMNYHRFGIFLLEICRLLVRDRVFGIRIF